MPCSCRRIIKGVYVCIHRPPLLYRQSNLLPSPGQTAQTEGSTLAPPPRQPHGSASDLDVRELFLFSRSKILYRSPRRMPFVQCRRERRCHDQALFRVSLRQALCTARAFAGCKSASESGALFFEPDLIACCVCRGFFRLLNGLRKMLDSGYRPKA